jgi:hypothetical protein
MTTADDVPTAVCNAKVAAVHAALDALLPTLSSSCQALLDMKTRRITCFRKVECGLDHVTLWNAMNNSMVQDDFPWTGGVICSRDKQTFKAETNFVQGQVNFTLTYYSTPILTRS